MNDCANDQIRDLLPDLLHERLGSTERAAVEAHVASCADCRDELSLLRELRGSVRGGPALDAAAIASAIPRYAVPVRRSTSTWRIAAAITLVAAGGASLALAARDRGLSAGRTQVAAVAGTPRADTVIAPVRVDPLTGSGVEPARVASAVRSTRAGSPTSSQGELPMTSGAITELSDSELASLLNVIDELDGMPSADEDDGPLVAPLDLEGSTR
jgi:anti-sigma factor RsiW